MSRLIVVGSWDWFDADGESGADIHPPLPNVTKTVVVNMRNSSPATYAGMIAAQCQDRHDRGQPIWVRFFHEYWIGDETSSIPRYMWRDDDPAHEDNWWRTATPFVAPQPPAQTVELLADLGVALRAELLARNLSVDWWIQDWERWMGYDGIPGNTQRVAFFAPVAEADGPYPHDPNPYLGATGLGNSSLQPLSVPFREEYNEWGWGHTAAINRSVIGQVVSSVPVPEGSAIQWTNYEDRPEGSITAHCAPRCYLDEWTNAAVPEGLTEQQQINTRRWAMFVRNANKVRHAAASQAEGGWIQPWISSPGFGTQPGSGPDRWCSPERLPYERILLRAMLAHLEAMGIYEYSLWYSVNDPNRGANAAWLEAYYAGRTVGPDDVRDLPMLDADAQSVTTVGNGRTVTTSAADLFGLTTVYYRRADMVLAMPGLIGWPWDPTDPIVISAGAAGDAELAALVAAIEINQGTEVGTEEIHLPPDPSPLADLSAWFGEPGIPVFHRALVRGDRFRFALPVRGWGDQAVSGVAVTAEVRAAPDGPVVHAFAPAGEDTPEGRRFVLDAATDAWPLGCLVCSIRVAAVGLSPVTVARVAVRMTR